MPCAMGCLSLFPVQGLPYFMAGAAALAIVASQLSGRLLARLGPVRVAPALVASNAALFRVEWWSGSTARPDSEPTLAAQPLDPTLPPAGPSYCARASGRRSSVRRRAGGRT